MENKKKPNYKYTVWTYFYDDGLPEESVGYVKCFVSKMSAFKYMLKEEHRVSKYKRWFVQLRKYEEGDEEV